MNKKIIRIISVLLLAFVLLGNMSNYVFADNVSDIVNNIDNYNGGNSNTNYDVVANKAGIILGYIQVIGTVLSIIILIILGIKYMLGSVEEKANFKESLKPYLIGVVLLFTSTLIPSLIFNAINKK